MIRYFICKEKQTYFAIVDLQKKKQTKFNPFYMPLGMTESRQNETVEKFRSGEYKVLVATSVGSEGIDVPDCNIVLSYNYSGNEITKIQMSG